jgi:long-chain acyl-CoA synthetase
MQEKADTSDTVQMELVQRTFYWAQKTPQNVFLRQPDHGVIHEYTWAHAANEIKQMANAIKKLNLPAGARIGIFSKNCAHWILADLAIWLAGYVSVPLYPNLNNQTANAIIEHSGMEAIFLGKLDKNIRSQFKLEKKIITIAFPYEEWPGALTWKNLIAENSSEWSGPTSRSLTDLATIIYTSGTTGLPKGVMHNFETFAFTGSNIIPHLKLNWSTERYFSYLPLAHVAERLVVETVGIYSGGSISFAESQETFLKDVQEASPTVFLAVPRIWCKLREGILKKVPQKKLDFYSSIPILSGLVHKKIRNGLGLNSVKLALTGSAATPQDTMKWYADIGVPIQEAYGLSENFAYSHVNVRRGIIIGSVGQPQAKVEVKIAPDGEILVKSRANMVGYYKDEAKTKSELVDGYLRTGDLGEVDADGYLRITGRAKDLFKTSKGKYVAPGPIELELSKSALIDQVCVVGDGLPQPLALAVLSESGLAKSAEQVKKEVESLMMETNKTLNQHERLSRVILMRESWSIENGFLTPTLKVKRTVIEKEYTDLIPRWSEQKEKVLQA